MCRVVYSVDKLYFWSFPVVLCCTLGIERHLFSPKLNARQNRVKVLQNDFIKDYFQNKYFVFEIFFFILLFAYIGVWVACNGGRVQFDVVTENFQKRG